MLACALMDTSWGVRDPARRWLSPSRWLASFFLSACDRVGSGTETLGRPLVHNEGRIEIGRGVIVRSLGSPVRLTSTATGKLSVGDGALIDVGATLFSACSVRIGEGAVIGPHALVCDRDEDGHSGEIIIERDVRIGAGAHVVGACRIGRGAVVLAGSVVRGDVAPGTVVRPEGGSPASDRTPAETNGVSHGTKPAVAEALQPPRPDAQARRTASAVLLADFTINELGEHLATADFDGLEVQAEIGPFDQVVPEFMALAQAASKPDLALLWTRPDAVSPSFRELLLGGTPALDAVYAEVDAFTAVLKSHASGARFVLVPSWVLPASRRGYGLIELRDARATNVLMRMNLRLADAVAQLPNTFVLDAQRWLAMATDGGVEPKLWHAGKVAFSSDVLAEAARDVRAALRGLFGMSRKLVVVDLDDTLWGGIVGDVGWENLRLGGHDPHGEAFVQFQRQLIALTKRGIALAVVSKNEETTALEAMRKHPEMVIRPESLAAFRINWRDKAQNLVEIAQELNLGLQSVVFLDDNPIERGRVREALPEVYVPEWPLDPTHYPRALDMLRCFESAHITAEDVERNAMYATERERASLRTSVSSFDDWLATLNMKVRFERVGAANVSRAAQLLNKTNQMNLRTRRMSEGELLEWAGREGHEAWAIHVSDRFGGAGLTGLLGLHREGEEVHVADYVLSCRVMGRRVEEAMVWAAKRRASALGAHKLVISPLATAKNKPCLDFFARAGLGKAEGGYEEPVDGTALYAPPPLVEIEGLE
jgi:FkbH-like protein